MSIISEHALRRAKHAMRWVAVAAAAGLVVGCATATSGNGATRNDMAVGEAGGPFNFGTTPTAADLAHDFSDPADGRGLPPGSGTYAQGKVVYETTCQACHGDHLQGGVGDRLIGGRGTLASGAPVKTVESYWPYATTFFDYVKRAMPFTAPGSLTDDQVYAVTAYVLAEANIVGKDATMNAQTLPQVKMPNRDGFITKDPRPDVP